MPVYDLCVGIFNPSSLTQSLTQNRENELNMRFRNKVSKATEFLFNASKSFVVYTSEGTFYLILS